jgi:hypothetical protein
MIIDVKIAPESLALVRNLQKLPTEFPQAIKRGLDKSLQVVSGRIVRGRLSGKGPFPPVQHRLGERSGQLKRSLRTEPAVIIGPLITGAIGSRIFYAAIHEYGRGKMPERAPVRTGVTENANYISGEVNKEVQRTLKKL